MATPMAPPVLPGYSLRVQLFSPNAHSLGDKPIRCFRVVTSPEATVREFCQESSRIHEINYGEPLAIKKVQDDQEFDITQSEILGNLFPNTSTIRVIQALANLGIRDSVPPTSALRFDPNTTRKREREGSARANGFSPSNTRKPNKRQKVSELDPDEPLPSRESESGGMTQVNIVPDLHQSLSQGLKSGIFGGSRDVRQDPPRIPETPSPSSPPGLEGTLHLANGSADQQGEQSAIESLDNHSKENLQVEIASPLRQALERAQSFGSQKGRSSSYHISRPTDRGRSVSTAATSPLSVDQQASTQNGTTPSSKRKRTNPAPKPQEKANRSPDEDSIYDNILSGDEGAAALRKKKASLKMRNSPTAGLPGITWAKNKFNTPPTGPRRPSRSREDSPSKVELPLTPNSKERAQRQQEKREVDEAKRARRAAAEAAEQRRLEAEEARQAEQARVAGEERAKREEQERIEIERFQRVEGKSHAKRQDMIAGAARLEKDQKEEQLKEAQEQWRLKEERFAKEKAKSERPAEKAELEAKRLREEEERKRVAQVKEAEILCQEEEARGRVKDAAEEKRLAGDALKKQRPSSTPKEPRQMHLPSPILPRGTPSDSKPQSSTPYIPRGRKSALKSSLSSQVIPSSSASVPKLSPECSRNVGIDAQMPLPSKLNRKVSFDLHGDRKETPIKPPSKILPPKLATPRVAASAASISSKVSKESTPKPSQQASVPPVKQSQTPIPVPSTLKRPSAERSTTPAGRTAILPLHKEITSQVTAKITPPGRFTSQKSETPVSLPTKAKTSLAETVVTSDSDSEEDIPARVSPAKRSKSNSMSSRPSLAQRVVAAPEQSENGEEIHEDETQSHNSSTRDSRSPVVFSQHVETSRTAQAQQAGSLESESNSEERESSSNRSDESDEEEEDEPIPKARTKQAEVKDAEEEGSEESEHESEDEGSEIQVPKSSPPVAAARPTKVSATGPNKANISKTSITEEEMSIQDEIDQQLTSSMFEARSNINSSAVPSSSAIRPPQLKYGASLTSLNTNKPLYGLIAAKPSAATRSSQAWKINLDDDSESESEEESDNDTTSSSDEEEDTTKSKSKPTAIVAAEKSKAAESESDDDFESSSDEESSEESVDDEIRVRNEVAAQIASMTNGDSQVSIPSPKASRGATQEVRDKQGKKTGKKVDKYVSGQKFSMPA